MCSNLFKCAQTCLKLVQMCPNMFNFVQTCSKLFQMCSNLFKTRWNVLKYVQTCSNVFKCIKMCSDALKCVQMCSNLFKTCSKQMWCTKGIIQYFCKTDVPWRRDAHMNTFIHSPVSPLLVYIASYNQFHLAIKYQGTNFHPFQCKGSNMPSTTW